MPGAGNCLLAKTRHEQKLTLVHFIIHPVQNRPAGRHRLRRGHIRAQRAGEGFQTGEGLGQVAVQTPGAVYVCALLGLTPHRRNHTHISQSSVQRRRLLNICVEARHFFRTDDTQS